MKSPSNREAWNRIAEVLHQMTSVLAADWSVNPPPYDTLPSEALDVAVSAWCYQLAKDPSAPLDAPSEVQPWVLARLMSAYACAKSNADAGDTPAPPINPNTMRQLLITEWHAALRDRWPLMMKPGQD